MRDNPERFIESNTEYSWLQLKLSIREMNTWKNIEKRNEMNLKSKRSTNDLEAKRKKNEYMKEYRKNPKWI